MFRLFSVIILAMFMGIHITVMVSDPLAVYWAHWAVLVGIWSTIIPLTIKILDNLKW